MFTQDNYPRAIEYLLYFFTNAYKENQEINLEVFMSSDDARLEGEIDELRSCVGECYLRTHIPI